MAQTVPLHRPKTQHERSRIHYQDPTACSHVAHSLQEKLSAMAQPIDKVVVMCIGTDRSTGDALGPLVGSRLQRVESDTFRVYGTVEQPVHASNLTENLEVVERRHADATIIAIDACLGKAEHVGCIGVRSGPLLPGRGVSKRLPTVGDIHIVGIVNVGGFMEYFVLQNTRLNLVLGMANTIADGLELWLHRFHNRPSRTAFGI